MGRTATKVSFYDELIIIEARVSGNAAAPVQPIARVAWRDVQAFRDDHADRVMLLRENDSIFFSPLGIPTINEQDRTAVLRLLIERGVPREERET